MRTTLEIDDDVLAAAKSLAKAANTTAGRIISDTMRRAIRNGLADQRPQTGALKAAEPQAVYGFTALTPAGWADDINPLQTDALNWAQLLRPNDITDAYLFSLAVSKQACLVSLDLGISLSWVVGAEKAHLVQLL